MKTILIAVGNPHFRFDNPHSAVASYLNTFKSHLEEQGHSVVLSDSIYKNDQQNANNSNNYSLVAIKSWIKKAVPKIFRRLSDKKFIQQLDNQTNNLLDNLKPDFIIEFLDYYSQLAYEFKKKYNVPYLLIYDAPIQQKYFDIYSHTSSLNSKLKMRESNSIENADYIICYSEPVWDYVQKHFNTHAEHQILPTIVWERMTEKNNSTEDGVITIGFIGSFLKWHYVDVLVKVFDQLAEKYKNIELLLIGYGLEWENVSKLVSQLKNNDKIKLTGFISDEEMEELKTKFDIGVMAGSNWYGSPLKIFEYSKLNIPVIGPDSPTVLDLFEAEKEIMVVDSNNPEKSLLQHLEKLINEPDLRKQLALALRTKVDNKYSKKYYFSCFDKLIETSLKKL